MSKYINTSLLITGMAIGTLVPLFAIDLARDRTVHENAASPSDAAQQSVSQEKTDLEETALPAVVDEKIENLLFGFKEAMTAASNAVAGAFTLEAGPSGSMSSNNRENIRFTGGAKFVSVK